MIAFDAAMFPATVTFYGPGTDPGARGAPSLTDPGTNGVTLTANVQPDETGSRGEGLRQPVGSKKWSVYTPSDPGASVDWSIDWAGRTFRVLARSVDQSSGDGVLWRTEAVEVS